MILNHLYVVLVFMLNFFQSDEPAYKGGRDALNSFISKNRVYPEFAKANCIQGTIYVRFKIDSAGNVLEPKVEKGLGIDLDDEAIRLIKLTSGNWQNSGNPVSLVIPVNFSLQNYNCESTSQESIQRAINYYRIQKGLETTVTKYYDTKKDSNMNERDEVIMRQLREELGLEEVR